MTDVDKRSAEYLLGGMPDHEREAFERDYFADPSAFERLAQAESDLLDAYVRHRLTPDQRARVERVYVADPRRRERVRFAQALADAADAAAVAPEDRPRRSPAWSGWPIAAAAAIAALL